MIAALFVDPRGCYVGVPDVDPWDEKRDARTYPGPHPVVAHPPCSRWCALAPLIEARWGHRVGDDGGCFAAALDAVRVWGGVLEHPAFSYAWAEFDLIRPEYGGWRKKPGYPDWTCEVWQRAYGHRAQKRTWLYYSGAQPPFELDWSRPAPEATVSYCANNGGVERPRLTKKQAAATPPAFRDMLVCLALHARAEIAA